MVKRKKKEAVELEQTKGTFRLVGKVSRVVDDANAKRPSWREGVGKETSSKAGVPYRSLNFSVITSQDGNVKNEIPVEMFGFEEDFMRVWNSETKKTEQIDLADIHDIGEKDMLMGVRVSLLEKDDDGEYITELLDEDGEVLLDEKSKPLNPRDHIESETFTTYDAIGAIYENIDNGDDVWISGQVEHSEYENQQGETVPQTRYKIQAIGTPKRVIDFDDEKFREKAYFEDELVYIGSELDTKAQALIISAKAINYKKETLDTTYRIDYSGDFEEGVEEEDKLEDMAKGIKKNAKLGDLFRVWGRITHSPKLITEVSSAVSKFGVKKGKPQQSMGSIERYLDIQGLDEGSEQRPKEFHIEGKYTEEDLFAPRQEEEKEEVEDRFARKGKRSTVGRSKPKVEDDDNFGTGRPIDISDEDLPF